MSDLIPRPYKYDLLPPGRHSRGFKLIPHKRDQSKPKSSSNGTTNEPFYIAQLDPSFLIKVFEKCNAISLARIRMASKGVHRFIMENEKHIGILIDEPLELSHVLDSKAREEDICFNINGRYSFDLHSVRESLSGYSFTALAFINETGVVSECLERQHIQQKLIEFLENKMWRGSTLVVYGKVPQRIVETIRPIHIAYYGKYSTYMPICVKQISYVCSHRPTECGITFLPKLRLVSITCNKICNEFLPFIRDALLKWENGKMPALKKMTSGDFHVCDYPDPRQDLGTVEEVKSCIETNAFQVVKTLLLQYYNNTLQIYSCDINVDDKLNMTDGIMKMGVQNNIKKYAQLNLKGQVRNNFIYFSMELIRN